MRLTQAEMKILVPLIDAGVKVTGLHLFQDDGGRHLQSAISKIQAAAVEKYDVAEIRIWRSGDVYVAADAGGYLEGDFPTLQAALDALRDRCALTPTP